MKLKIEYSLNKQVVFLTIDRPITRAFIRRFPSCINYEYHTIRTFEKKKFRYRTFLRKGWRRPKLIARLFKTGLVEEVSLMPGRIGLRRSYSGSSRYLYVGWRRFLKAVIPVIREN